MIKIKVSGIKKFEPIEVECSNCDSVLEVNDIADVKVEQGEEHGEMGSYTYVTVECPACSRPVNVPDEHRDLIIKLKRIR